MDVAVFVRGSGNCLCKNRSARPTCRFPFAIPTLQYLTIYLYIISVILTHPRLTSPENGGIRI